MARGQRRGGPAMPSATRTARRSIIVAGQLGITRAQAAQVVMTACDAVRAYLAREGIDGPTWIDDVHAAAFDIWQKAGGVKTALSVQDNSPDAEPLFPLPAPPPFPHAADFPELFGETTGTSRATRAPRTARLHRHSPETPETCTTQCTPPHNPMGDYLA